MRILMLGTGPFAVPTFSELLKSPHVVAGLVTAPLRTHRGKPIVPVGSIREVARQHGLAIFDPEDINALDSQARLAEFVADLMVVCDYGQILSPATLATARRGGVNLHASLLPKYRGAAPINWAIFHGETETGATVIHMTPRIDAGPCIAQAQLPIDPDETAEELEARLANLGARLVCETIDLLEEGRASALPQDATLASRAPRLKKSDGLIDWSHPATAIKNHVRAMEPWPKTYTFLHRPAGPPLRLILGPLKVVELSAAASDSRETTRVNVPGTVIEAAGNCLVIAAGIGAIAPAGIKPAGKRMMTIDEFLRGYPIELGERFGPES